MAKKTNENYINLLCFMKEIDGLASSNNIEICKFRDNKTGETFNVEFDKKDKEHKIIKNGGNNNE